MPFVEDDHVVEQIAAAVADPALGDAILPRTSVVGSLGLNAEVLDHADHFFIELCATIKDQVAGRGVVRECLAQLLNNPRAGRVFGHIAMKDASPVMCNDEEAIEHAEGKRRHGEEVHRGDGLTMIAEKRRPSSCQLGTPRRFPHPAQHGPLRNFEAKHYQLTMNARRTPCGIFSDHAEDEFAQFFVNAFSSHAVPMPREPCPVQPESCSVPTNDSLRLDEDQRPFPSRPKPPQDYPEQFVRSGKARLRMPLFQDGELLSQSQILQKQIAARSRRLKEQDKQELQRAEHMPFVAEKTPYRW